MYTKTPKSSSLSILYDWPDSYVYVPWPHDNLAVLGRARTPEEIQERNKMIERARMIRDGK